MTALRPEDIAARWQCSPRHVRNMITRGELPSFRLGGKLQRVLASDVEAFERYSQNSALSPIVATSMPNGAKTESSAGRPFVPKIVKMPSKR
jgi:excisionase family DNA binding protein